MKLFGHPLHIMLIHFPSALFPMDFVCSLIAYCTGIKPFAEAAFYALTGGSVLGWLAIMAGTFDLIHIMNNKPSAMKNALIHGGINTAVLIAFSAIAYVTFQKYPLVDSTNLPLLIFKGALIVFMLWGNLLGGNLILKDKVLEKNEN